jgi:outer membrane murein-binding lipoprotein Lpp
MSPSILSNDRLVELLVHRAIDGTLNASERMELKQLLAQQPYRDSDQFDQTAAALLIAGSADDEPLPKALRTRLLQQADTFNSTAPASVITSIAPQRAQRTAQVEHAARPAQFSASKLAWFAAAASVLLAVAGWWPRLAGKTGGSEQMAQVAPPAPTLQEQLDKLAKKPSAIRRDWTATAEPAAQGAEGDVVWDPQSQKGYVRFRGLAANDPRKQQYQLWIFDAARGDKYPVDGGVFDIPATGGEVVVPIQARLPVMDAAMFAVTLERAGGVVVSEREHIVVLAKVVSG